MIPGVQAVRRLSLDLREAELEIESVTPRGIPRREGRRDLQRTTSTRSRTRRAVASTSRTRWIWPAPERPRPSRGRASRPPARTEPRPRPKPRPSRRRSKPGRSRRPRRDTLAENWPAIVEAAAKPFASIDNFTVLNGASGPSEARASALSRGVAGLGLARQLLGAKNALKADATDAETPVLAKRANGRKSPRPVTIDS